MNAALTRHERRAVKARAYVAKKRHAKPCPVCGREIVPDERCLTWMQRTPSATFAIQRVHAACEPRLRADQRAGRTAAVVTCAFCTEGVVDPASKACGNCGSAAAAIAPRSPYSAPQEAPKSGNAAAPSRDLCHQLLEALLDMLVEAARLSVKTWRQTGAAPAPDEDRRAAAAAAVMLQIRSGPPTLLRDACFEYAAAESGMSVGQIRKAFGW